VAASSRGRRARLLDSRVVSVPAVRVLVTTAGNEFMLDIASTLAEGMRAEGVTCELALDGVPAAVNSSVLQIVVAPHEYFPLFLNNRLQDEELERAIATTHLLNVEQPGSQWFEQACRYARTARGVFDLSREGVEEFHRRGIDAVHTPLGIIGGPERPLPSVISRPIDILFLGHASPRRERFFADQADALSRYNCRLLFVDVTRPRQMDTPGYISDESRSAILAQTKILLNVHSADRRYFETHRALLALSHGCVLLTESSEGTEPLVNGIDFVMAPIHDLMPECERLLACPDQLDAVARSGHVLATTRMKMADSCRRMVEHALPVRAKVVRRVSDNNRHEVRERLDLSMSIRSAGDADWTVEENGAYRTSEVPGVTVIITVFNYGRFLRECFESVAAADRPDGGFEILIVDDASTDDSLAVARGLMGGTTVPTRLVLKHRNTGLADARNVGLQVARGDFVLTLDADNWIYPSCLRELALALGDGTTAAVYPILRRYQADLRQAAGLLSLYPWSVRELLRGPYIDALAMFRRHALQRVGGYSTELIEHGWFGWEDYDLWLKLADAGYTCAQVPQILASYRVHSGSMIGTTNEGTKDIARHLRSKFAKLSDACPGLDRYFGFPVVDREKESVRQAGPLEDPSVLVERYCRDLEGRLHAMHQSWSWRITAPLRTIYRLLSGRTT
jgi:glycosyltransferase involved in cell wall biosynthesis